jgi:hypothetical protein
MNKKQILGVILAFIFLFMLFPLVSRAASTIFADDFETYASTAQMKQAWNCIDYPSDTTVTLLGTGGINDSKCMKLYDNSEIHRAQAFKFFNTTQLYCQFWVKVSDIHGYGAIQMSGSNGTHNTGILYIIMLDGIWRASNITHNVNTQMGYAANIWYEIEIYANCTTDSYSSYVNDTPLCIDFPLGWGVSGGVVGNILYLYAFGVLTGISTGVEPFDLYLDDVILMNLSIELFEIPWWVWGIIAIGVGVGVLLGWMWWVKRGIFARKAYIIVTL